MQNTIHMADGKISAEWSETFVNVKKNLRKQSYQGILFWNKSLKRDDKMGSVYIKLKYTHFSGEKYSAFEIILPFIQVKKRQISKQKCSGMSSILNNKI